MRVNHGDVPEGAVFAGVDTHADAHWLCVLDAVGRPLLSEAFPATPEGYDALAAAVAGAGEPIAIGVEGTATYGAGLARRLSELGLPVWEVLQPEKRRRPRGLEEERPRRRRARGAQGALGRGPLGPQVARRLGRVRARAAGGARPAGGVGDRRRQRRHRHRQVRPRGGRRPPEGHARRPRDARRARDGRPGRPGRGVGAAGRAGPRGELAGRRAQPPRGSSRR